MNSGTNRNRNPECESLPLLVQQVPTRVLLALQLIGQLKLAPRLVSDRDARGHPFTRLRYKRIKGMWRWFNVGGVDSNNETIMSQCITARWPVTRNELIRKIRIVIEQRRQAQLKARKLAARCGYSFRGWMIHRSRRRRK